MSPAYHETLTCHWCSRARPKYRTHTLASQQTICDYCLDWHLHALEFLSGNEAPRGCYQCGKSWPQLRDETPGVEVRLYGVPKDGFYQLLCSACVQPYLPKRRDLYQGTEFGRNTLKL